MKAAALEDRQDLRTEKRVGLIRGRSTLVRRQQTYQR